MVGVVDAPVVEDETSKDESCCVAHGAAQWLPEDLELGAEPPKGALNSNPALRDKKIESIFCRLISLCSREWCDQMFSCTESIVCNNELSNGQLLQDFRQV